MSHFSVVVIGENPEEQLAPYQENNMGDCPEEYMEFNDQEDEMLEEYETKSTHKVKGPDGSLYWSWDEKFRKPGTFGTGSDTHAIPSGYVEVEVPFKELYPTFEAFAEDYHGHKSRDEQKGRYGYWENPNRKWDWYELGGRWTGYFPLKPGAEGITGRPGLMTDPAKKGYADAALLKDIDIERAQREEEVEARAKFAKWRRCFESFGRPESWEEVKTRICGDGESFDSTKLDEARAFYNGQVAIVECNKEFGGHYWGCPVEDFGFLEEVYVDKRKYGALVPFAVVKDGQWYERAEMGWFAITSNETMTYEDWCVQFHKMIAELPGDTLISMYDCHI